MSIQKKVVIAILITGFIALTIGLLVTYYQTRNVLTEAIGRDFAEIAKKTAERFDAAVKEEVNTFRRLAEEPAFIAAVKGERRKAIEDYLIHYMRHADEREEHLGLLVVNEEGRIIGDIKLKSDNRIEQSDEVWWRVTYNGGDGKLYAGDIYLEKLSGNSAFDIGVPVIDPATRKVIGGIRSIMNVDVFFRFIKDMSFGRTGHGMLVDSEGTPLICSLLPLVEHSMNQPLIHQIISKGSGWAVAEDDAHGGRNSIIGFSPVEFINSLGSESLGGHKWYTFIRQAPVETFAPVNRLLFKIFILESVIVLLVCLLGVYIVRRLLLQPVNVLHDGVEKISKGNLNHRIDIRTGDELEALANGFNRMSEALKEFYYDLEGKIKERTAALRTSETKYRTLMEHAYDAIFLINPDNGQIIEANLQAEMLTGLSKEELLKIKYWGLYPQQMVNQATEQFNKGVKRGFTNLHDVSIKKKDGGIARVDISARLIEYNNIKVFHTVMKDITEIKKEEEKLSMTSEQLARSTMVMLEQDTKLARIREEVNFLVKHLNMSDILTTLFKLIADRTGVSRMALFEQAGEVMQCCWIYGVEDKRLQKVSIPIEEDDPVNDAIRNLRVIRKGDLNKKSRIDRYFEDWIVFPLRGKDRIIGAFVAGPIGLGGNEGMLQPFVDIVAVVFEKDNMVKGIKI